MSQATWLRDKMEEDLVLSQALDHYEMWNNETDHTLSQMIETYELSQNEIA